MGVNGKIVEIASKVPPAELIAKSQKTKAEGEEVAIIDPKALREWNVITVLKESTGWQIEPYGLGAVGRTASARTRHADQTCSIQNEGGTCDHQLLV